MRTALALILLAGLALGACGKRGAPKPPAADPAPAPAEESE